MCQSRRLDVYSDDDLSPDLTLSTFTEGIHVHATPDNPNPVALQDLREQAHYQVAKMILNMQSRGALPAETALPLCQRHLQAALQANPSFVDAQQLLMHVTSGAFAMPAGAVAEDRMVQR